jgi:uncharacterized protein YjgD (DUF1641 family)
VAQQLDFKPKPFNPLEEVRRKLEVGTLEHTTAVLNGYRLLQTADDHGVLDLLRGMIAAGDFATTKAASFAATPNGIGTARNLLTLGKVIGTIDPDLLHNAVADVTTSVKAEKAAYRDRPPTFWATLRRAFSPDAVRGLSLAITVLSSVGRTIRNAE